MMYVTESESNDFMNENKCIKSNTELIMKINEYRNETKCKNENEYRTGVRMNVGHQE